MTSGPRCPGCGYEIFGLRDMVCPECGRKLDVRDFNLDTEDTEGRQKKLRRDARIGVPIGFLAVLLPAAIFILPLVYLISKGLVPHLVCWIIPVAFAVWIWRILAWVGNEARPRKKR